MQRPFAALYRLVLRLIAPRSLRDEYGAEMEALFAEMLEGAIREGPVAVVRLWIREVAQLIGTVRALSRPLKGSPRYDESPGWRPALDRVRGDVRLALLGLVRRPLYSASVSLTLAVGLGLTAAVLSVSRASILAPIPVPDADRLMVITGAVNSPEWTGRTGVSFRELDDLSRGTTQLDGMAVYSLAGNATLSQADQAVRLRVSLVGPTYFQLTGVELELGRSFGPAEIDDPSLPHAILTWQVWNDRFEQDSGIVGRGILLSGRSYTVIGVLARGYAGMDRTGVDVWLPVGRADDFIGPQVLSGLDRATFWAIGRMAPGASMASAAEELANLHREFGVTNPLPEPRTVGVMGLREFYFGGTRRPLGTVALGALLVLLICTVNVAVLIELRGRQRAGELAVRSAIGGSSGRILSLMLTESAALSLVGWIGAIGLAHLAIGLFMGRFQFSMPFFEPPGISIGTMGGMLVLAVLINALPTAVRAAVAVGAGGAPRVRRAIGAGMERSRLSLPVVAGETALAAVVLIAAILSLRSLTALDAVELGYQPRGLESVRMDLAGSEWAQSDGPARLARELSDRFVGTPGVEVGIMGPDMMGRSVSHMTATPAGGDPSAPEDRRRVQWISLTPGTMDALGMELVEGRDVAWTDLPGGDVATVLSQDAAARLWPGESAIGKRYHLNRAQETNAVVVGVVRPAKHTVRWGGGYVIGSAYFPIQQVPVGGFSLLYRTTSGNETGLPMVRDVVHSIDPSIALYDAAPMMARLRGEESNLRLVLTLSSVYASIALVLVLGGLVSLMLSSVQQRRGELAIRGALGADRSSLVWTIGRGAVVALALGTVTGALLATLILKPLEAVLFGVTSADPGTYLMAGGVLMVLGLAAALVPAGRTAGVPPAEVMRG